MRAEPSTSRSLAVVIGLGAMACTSDAPPPSPVEPTPAPLHEASASAPARVAAPATSRPEPADVAALAIPTPAGWSAHYSEALQSWTVQRDASATETSVAAERFYVDALPSDAPTELEAYARALATDPGFQDAGYLFVTIDRKEAVDDGWLIVGTSKDTSDDASEGSPSFVLLRAALGVYCHSGTFLPTQAGARSRDSREVAIDICTGIRARAAAAARP